MPSQESCQARSHAKPGVMPSQESCQARSHAKHESCQPGVMPGTFVSGNVRFLEGGLFLVHVCQVSPGQPASSLQPASCLQPAACFQLQAVTASQPACLQPASSLPPVRQAAQQLPGCTTTARQLPGCTTAPKLHDSSPACLQPASSLPPACLQPALTGTNRRLL